jgi:hypothetical protein
MSRFGRYFGAKVAVLGSLITTGALAVMFFAVVPHLRASLERQRLAELERDAPAFTPVLADAAHKEIKAYDLDQLVRSLAGHADAKVSLWGAQVRPAATPAFYVLSNSDFAKPVFAKPGLQKRASETGKLQGAIVDGPSGKTAQVVVPVPYEHPVWTVVYTRDLSGVHGTVSVFAFRILLIAAMAILLALIGGYLVARRTAPRVNKLEMAG